jgi:ATP phosphoribosyltransferase regulatory subunit HisZ
MDIQKLNRELAAVAAQQSARLFDLIDRAAQGIYEQRQHDLSVQDQLDAALEKVISVLRQQTRKSNVLQGGKLIERLTIMTGLDAAMIRVVFRVMKNQGWIEASGWSGTYSPVGRVTVSLPPAQTES